MTKKICAACKKEISSCIFVTIGNEGFHQDCFKCFKCSEAISGGYSVSKVYYEKKLKRDQ